MDYSAPNAESTHLENSETSSASSPRFMWGGKFTPRNKRTKKSPIPEPMAKIPPTRLRNIDPQVYIDTQSRGLASRAVKYYDESQQKAKLISSPLYRRPGDFPVVNLEKTKITLKPQQSKPSTPTVRIAPPIRSNYLVTPRAVIMSGGRLGAGDSVAFSSTPHSVTPNENEPLVSHAGDYETTPTSSALDALTEISRKRMHCDELDGEHKKKQRAESLANNALDGECNNSLNMTAKRVRDRTSPNYQGISTETQKKRYKSNDIYSSLSSSIHLMTPKRKLDDLQFPEENGEVDHGKQQEQVHRNEVPARTQVQPVAAKQSFEKEHVHGEVLPKRDTREVPQISKKPPNAVPAVPKLTLFNKKYDEAETYSNNDDSDEDEGPRISFVKPKTTTSTVFQLSKEKRENAQRTKLSMMLSCLAGDPCDEADEPDGKIEKSEVSRAETAISPVLSTATSVTFSTATTTSVLNLPISTAPPSKAPSTADTPKSSETATAVSRSLNFNSPELKTAVTSTPLEATQPNLSFTVPATQPVATSSGPTSLPSAASPVTSALDKPAPRIGGFSFSVAPTTDALTASANKSQEINTNGVVSSTNVNSAPAFSFGLANKGSPTIATTPNKTIGSPPGFGFGASIVGSAAPSTNTNTGTSSNPLNSSFSFGSDTKVTNTTSANSPPSLSFGQSSQTNALSTSTALPQFETKAPISVATITTTTASPFSFGGSNKPTTVTPSAVPATTAGATLFGFGNIGQEKAPPAFGSSGTSSFPSATSASSITGIKFGEVSKPVAAPVQTSNPFQFGNPADKTAPPAFGSSFSSNTISTPAPAFGANVPTTTALPGNLFAFGASNATPTPASSAQPPSVFGITGITTASNLAFGGNANSTFTQPSNNIFGANTAKTAEVPSFGGGGIKPTFGSSSFTTAQTPSFGSTATNQPTPLFGGLNNSSANSTSAFGGASALNQAFTTPNNNSANAFGSDTSTQNASVFGSSNVGFGSSQPAVTTASTGIFGQSTQPQGVFSFGGQPSGASSVVATPVTTQSGGAFGVSNSSSFAFGSTAPSNGVGLFGSGKPEATVSPFSFNASAQPAPTPAFGKESNAAFNFGAKQSPFGGAPAAEATKAFSFGGVANANPVTSPFGGGQANAPAFGSSSASAAPAFGSSSASAAPAFGASSASADASKPFSFGSNMSDTSKAFAFNSGPATAPVAASAFNFSATPAAPTLSANAFQFNAGAGAPPMGQNNLFSIGPGGGASNAKGRPIRQATRRMNK